MTAQKRVLSLFAGIGGFDLGLERAGGFETVAFCEIDPFCRKVLAKHWPDVPCYEDVRELTSERLAADGIAVDVITGGFPCQDISIAGKRAGMAKGTRSGLWSECKRLVGELRPQFALFENVPNLLSGPSEQPGGWFATILSDLASLGFDAEWHYLPASFVGPGIGGAASGYLPTPKASADAKGSPRNRFFGSNTCRSNLREFLRDGPDDPIYPHPSFVERVMGFPIGHTDLNPSATQSFPKSPNLSDAQSTKRSKDDDTR
jgi:DNA (cytosine-5)-methyltransferase 1